ncbi:TPA: hypothetical protein ACGO3V_001163 [Streptococcus suis]
MKELAFSQGTEVQVLLKYGKAKVTMHQSNSNDDIFFENPNYPLSGA